MNHGKSQPLLFTISSVMLNISSIAFVLSWVNKSSRKYGSRNIPWLESKYNIQPVKSLHATQVNSFVIVFQLLLLLLLGQQRLLEGVPWSATFLLLSCHWPPGSPLRCWKFITVMFLHCHWTDDGDDLPKSSSSLMVSYLLAKYRLVDGLFLWQL